MTVHIPAVQLNKPPFLGGGNWSISELNEVTIFFGKNGSGKSLLLRAWRDSLPETTHYVTPERTGEMDFQPQYLQQELTFQNRQQNSSRNYVPEYRRRIIGRIQSYFLTRGDYRGNGLVPAPPGELETFINSLVTDFSLELVAASTPPYSLKRIKDGVAIGGVDHLSSGEAQLVTLALDILTIAAIWEIEGKDKRVILIDEPDAHIHPDLEVRFADFIFRVKERFNVQIAIATHSTSLLAALGQFGGTLTSVVYIDKARDQFQARPFSAIQKELAACLGGHALMGPLFGAPILLVEGDDDYRIWSQIPRHHVTNFSVIPSNGEEIHQYQKSLENIFSALRDPAQNGLAGFALLDGDKPKPQANEDRPQNHIQYIQLSCLEAENLYVTDEVLAVLGIDWALAAIAIMKNAHRFGNKERQLLDVLRWDRKRGDLKNVIQEISQILDPKNVHWTVRVGKAIGSEKPTGQLLEYLGDEVVDALWQ
jgi:ABC-type cobalamin/Fe3+-siderophores transport system ATPase subunit